MQIPTFVGYLDHGLKTPFEYPYIASFLAIPYLITQYVFLSHPTRLYQYLLPITVFFIGYKFTIYTITYAIHDKENLPQQIYTHLTSHSGSIILTALTVFILLSVGYALFILPGVYLTLRFSLAVPLAIRTGNNPITNIKDSYLRTKSYQLSLLGTFAEMFLISIFLFVSFSAAVFVGFKFTLLSWLALFIINHLTAVVELGVQGALIEVLQTSN